MERKGELLNQLAIISDLIEKINIEIKLSSLIFELDKEEFDKVYNIIERKYGVSKIKPESTFNLKIGSVEIIFNKSSA